MDMKMVGRAVVVGAAGAVVLIVANGLNYFVQDVLFRALSLGWGIESTISSLGDFALYPLSIVVGLAIGVLAVWLCRDVILSLKQTLILPAIAGLTLGVMGLVARVGYELILRPLVGGYSVGSLNALIILLSACTDIAMMVGLAVAGGAFCAAFLLKQLRYDF